jgi:hypothetical protein
VLYGCEFLSCYRTLFEVLRAGERNQSYDELLNFYWLLINYTRHIKTLDGTCSTHRGINMLTGITVVRCKYAWSDNIKAYLMKVVVCQVCGWNQQPAITFCGVLLWTQCGERWAVYGCCIHRRGPHFVFYNSHADFLIGSHIGFRSSGMWRCVDGWVLLS